MTDPTPGLVSVTTPSPSPGGGAHAAPAAETPSATGSPLGALRDRRAAMLEHLYTDLRVPRWGDADGGPRIFVRYSPAAPSEFQERIDKVQKQAKKPKDWMVTENAQVLVSSCIGVYAVEGDEPLDGEDGRPKLSLRDGDPYGPWTRFDPDLANSLGLPENCGAVAVVRALYLTEPDIASTVNKLLQWSGIALPQDSTGFFGS